jgi:hypothetical protein
LSTSGDEIISHGFSHSAAQRWCSQPAQQTLRLQGTKETLALIFCCTLRALYSLARSLARSLKKLYIVQEMKQHPFAREKGRNAAAAAAVHS